MRFSQWLALAALMASGILLWNLRDVLIHIFAGVVLATGLCSLVDQLRAKLPMPRPLGLFICLASLFLIFSVALAVLVPPFIEEFQELLMQLPEAAKELWKLLIKSTENISGIVYRDSPKDILDQRLFPNNFNPIPDGAALASGLSEGIQKILGLAGDLGSGLVQLLFVLAVTLMVAMQPKAYKEVAIILFPSFYRRRANFILKQCGESLSNWMVGVLISSFCVALLAGIGLSLLGVKLVIANALLAGSLNIIPNVGPTLSTVFPMSVALLDAPWKALTVVGLYVIIQNLECYLITPSIMQHQVKLLPGLTLAAQFIFTVIFGPIGLLLALPLAVVLQVFIREIVVHDLLDQWKKKRLTNG